MFRVWSQCSQCCREYLVSLRICRVVCHFGLVCFMSYFAVYVPCRSPCDTRYDTRHTKRWATLYRANITKLMCHVTVLLDRKRETQYTIHDMRSDTQHDTRHANSDCITTAASYIIKWSPTNGVFKYCPWSQNWPRLGGHFICIEIYWMSEIVRPCPLI